MNRENDAFGLSDEYWASLDERNRDLYRVIRPLRHASYKVDVPLARIEGMLEEYAKDAKTMGGTLEINPDFQRGHVWTRDKQEAYIENLFRGLAPATLRFNCAGWQGLKKTGDLNPGDIVCIDGLQRLTAVREFMAGNITVFGGKTAQDLKGSSFDPSRSTSWRISVEMFEIPTRAELLQFYLDINRGGVVHAPEELERVEGLLQAAKTPARKATPKPRS